MSVAEGEVDYWKPLQIGADVAAGEMAGQVFWMLYRTEAFTAVADVADQSQSLPSRVPKRAEGDGVYLMLSKVEQVMECAVWKIIAAAMVVTHLPKVLSRRVFVFIFSSFRNFLTPGLCC